METATVKFCNWEKYQGDSKRYETASWFRVETKIYLSEVWDLLPAEEFKAFMFLLAFTVDTAHKSGEVKMAIPKWARLSGSTVSIFESLLKKLTDNGIVAITEPAPCNHGAITVQSPGTHSDYTALRNETIRNETKRDVEEAAPPKKQISVIPNPISPIEELIASVPIPIQVTWENVWGSNLVLTQMPKAASWWITNPDLRKEGDTWPRFANGWFQREKDKLARAPAVAPIPIAGKADKPPPPTLVEQFDPITGELKIYAAPQCDARRGI